MKKFIRRLLAFIISLIVCVLAWFLIRTQFYYSANVEALSAIMDNRQLIISENDDTITITPVNVTADYTFIFYPGAKVDAHSYLAKLWSIALDHNMKIIISKPPLHLQIFAINAAENISGENIIIGGHSLGGSMACEYVKSHPNTVSGMILMGAYCNGDISSQTGVKTLIISASNDWVLPVNKIHMYDKNLASWFTFSTLSGASHAQFGNYGLQKWDGLSTLSNDEVLSQLSQQIGVFLESIKK